MAAPKENPKAFSKEDTVNRVILAALPLLAVSLQLKEACLSGFLVALGYVILLPARRIFMAQMGKSNGEMAATALVGLAAILARGFWGLTPVWAASLYLMLPERPGKFRVPALFRQAAGFWLVMTALGLSGEILGAHLGFSFFLHPASSFLFLGLLALMGPGRRAS